MVLIAWMEFARFLMTFWPIVLPVLALFWGVCCVYLAALGAQEITTWLEERFTAA